MPQGWRPSAWPVWRASTSRLSATKFTIARATTLLWRRVVRWCFKVLCIPCRRVAGLGVHATLDLGGRVRFGPDAQYVKAPDYAVDPAKAEDLRPCDSALSAGGRGKLAGGRLCGCATEALGARPGVSRFCGVGRIRRWGAGLGQLPRDRVSGADGSLRDRGPCHAPTRQSLKFLLARGRDSRAVPGLAG